MTEKRDGRPYVDVAANETRGGFGQRAQARRRCRYRGGVFGCGYWLVHGSDQRRTLGYREIEGVGQCSQRLHLGTPASSPLDGGERRKAEPRALREGRLAQSGTCAKLSDRARQRRPPAPVPPSADPDTHRKPCVD